MNRLFRAVVAAAVALLGAQSARAQDPLFLQSFTTPATPVVLQSFAWGGLATSMPYTFGLYGFDGAHLTTTALWSEAMTNAVTAGDIQTFSPNVLLAADGMYAIGVSGGSDLSQSIMTGADLYPLGRFYLHLGSGYQAVAQEQDVGNFSTTLVAPPTTTTPEPASLALLATGLVGFAIVRRRRIGAA